MTTVKAIWLSHLCYYAVIKENAEHGARLVGYSDDPNDAMEWAKDMGYHWIGVEIREGVYKK